MRGVEWRYLTVSVLISALLAVCPLPEAWRILRPEFVMLVVVYWALMLPYHVGLGAACMAGIMLDGLRVSSIGQNALAMVFVVYLVQLMHRRIRMFSVVKQSLFIGVLSLVYLVINHSVYVVAGYHSVSSLQLFYPMLGNMLLWPVLCGLLLKSNQHFVFT
jgi:rod shape-determining protein MreD